MFHRHFSAVSELYALMGLQQAAPRGSRVRARGLDQIEPPRDESDDRRVVDDALQRLTRLHFCPGGGAAAGYLARSACHFLTSSGLFVAVYSSMRRSSASGMRALPCGGIVFYRCFIPS
jgi:hypothetical protein